MNIKNNSKEGKKDMRIAPTSKKYLNSEEMDYVLWFLFQKFSYQRQNREGCSDNNEDWRYAYKKETDEEILKKMSKSSLRRNLPKLKKLGLITETKDSKGKKVYLLKHNFIEENEKGYVLIPKDKIDYLISLNNSALKTYLYLVKLSRHGEIEAYPKRKTICKEIGLGEHSDLLISAYTKTLKKLGLIDIRTEEHINEDGHYYTKNYYKILGFEKVNVQEEIKKIQTEKEEQFYDDEIIW